MTIIHHHPHASVHLHSMDAISDLANSQVRFVSNKKRHSPYRDPLERSLFRRIAASDVETDVICLRWWRRGQCPGTNDAQF